jgi:hypothetical protein
VVSVTDPYGRILDFLDRIRYFFIQVAPQLGSRGSVDHVPDGILLTHIIDGLVPEISYLKHVLPVVVTLQIQLMTSLAYHMLCS